MGSLALACEAIQLLLSYVITEDGEIQKSIHPIRVREMHFILHYECPASETCRPFDALNGALNRGTFQVVQFQNEFFHPLFPEKDRLHSNHYILFDSHIRFRDPLRFRVRISRSCRQRRYLNFMDSVFPEVWKPVLTQAFSLWEYRVCNKSANIWPERSLRHFCSEALSYSTKP